MFGKKAQIIKYQKEQYMLRSFDSDPIFVKYKSPVIDEEAVIEVPANHYAFVLKSGDYSKPLNAGIHRVFGDKNEIKEWKNGCSLDIVFAEKDKAINASWNVFGDSSTIFEDPTTKETVVFRKAEGSFNVKVTDVMQLYARTVGDKEIYRVEDLEKEAKDYITSAFINCFFNIIEERKINFISIARFRNDIANGIAEMLNDQIRNKGYEFVSLLINTLDLDYEDAAAKKHLINERNDILSDDEEKIRQIRHEEEDRLHAREMDFARLDSQTKIGVAQGLGGSRPSEIITVVCPHCGRENPADVEYCVFCKQKLER